MVNGIIKNFRLGPRTQRQNQFVVDLAGNDKKKSSALIGKKAVWQTESGKEIVGKVTGLHGAKGSVKVRFDKSLPGQAIGTEILIK